MLACQCSNNLVAIPEIHTVPAYSTEVSVQHMFDNWLYTCILVIACSM